jgi:NAD(P)-dependent dehydrogenase (short-subunit alcohol dehydrogenase family)
MQKKGQVIITGAAGGMGKATCQLLTQHHYQVIAVDHHVDRLIAVKQKIPGLKTLAIDLTDEHLTTHLQQTLDPNSTLVGLVNMAGISKGNSINQLTDQEWNDSFAINVTPAMQLIRFVAPYMQQQKQGSIINIGSPVGFIGARKPSYAASKAALQGLTMSCARNLGGDRIRVNLLLPGPTMTYMTADWDEQRCQSIADGSFLKRLCTPREIAQVIVFLLGEQSTYITGSIIDMTAGSMYGH